MDTVLETGRDEIKSWQHAQIDSRVHGCDADQEYARITGQPLVNGVVIGILAGLEASGLALVDFPKNKFPNLVPARSATPLSEKNLGQQIVLAFEAGDLTKPIILGLVHTPTAEADKAPVKIEVDGAQLVFIAERELVLRCGKASITLTRAGKVLIHGEYVISASAGVNRIQGGSVQIN